MHKNTKTLFFSLYYNFKKMYDKIKKMYDIFQKMSYIVSNYAQILSLIFYTAVFITNSGEGKGASTPKRSADKPSLKEKATSPFRPLVQTMESVENSFGVYTPFPQSSLTPRIPHRLFLYYLLSKE